MTQVSVTDDAPAVTTAQSSSRFRRNFGLVGIASFAGFGISLVLTPVMTRLYGPHDYGVFAVVNNLASFGATLGLLSLPNALALEHQGSKRAQISNAIIHLANLSFVIAFLLVTPYIVFAPTSATNAELLAFGVAPVLLYATALQRFSLAWAGAYETFGLLSIARVAHPLFAKVGAIVTAVYFGPHANGLVFWETAGFLLQTRIIIKRSLWKILAFRRTFSLRRVRVTVGVLRRHHDTTLFGNASSLMELGVTAAMSVLLAVYFSTKEVGLYSLAVSITSLPIQLVALATAPVIYAMFIRSSQNAPSTLPALVTKAMLGYAAAGVPVYMALQAFGPEIFALAFGSAWRESGDLAAILVAPALLGFVVTPLSSVMRVAQMQSKTLLVDAIFWPLTIAVVIGSASSNSLAQTLENYAVVFSTHRLLCLGLCLHAARQVARNA